MKARRITCLGLLAALTFPTLAPASNLVTHGQNNPRTPQGTHTLSLQCPTSETTYLMSRLAVLDIDRDSAHDVAITTGHGLLDSHGQTLTDCRVHDFKGHTYEITGLKIAPDYAPGTANDWAIVTFEKARKTPLIRYALATPLETGAFDELAETNLPVRFSSARGLPGSGQDCAMLPRRHAGFEPKEYSGLLPHNCRAVSGQSGAPISVTRKGHNIIMGIHVGHAFLLSSPHNDGPIRYGYMRVFDDHLRNHVNSIIMDLTPQKAH